MKGSYRYTRVFGSTVQELWLHLQMKGYKEKEPCACVRGWGVVRVGEGMLTGRKWTC